VVCSRTNVKPSTRIRETLECWNRHQVILSTSHGRLAHPSKYPLSALLQGCILQKRNLPSFHLENRPMSGDRSTCIYTKKATSWLQDSWRDSTSHPQAVSLWDLGVPDWRRRGGRWTCGVLRSWRAEVWGCEAEGRRVRRHMLWIHVSWRVCSRGYRTRMCARLRAWPHSLLVPSRERLRHGKYGSLTRPMPDNAEFVWI
jgi:hypothetical protein